MSDLKCKPRAWILEPKVQRHPPRHAIRSVSAVEPTQAQRELADLDGDVYVPLYEIDHHWTSLEKLRHALITGASLLEQGYSPKDVAAAMRRAALDEYGRLIGEQE